MALSSNYTYAGYQAWAWRSGVTASLDTKGPWFDWTAYADSQGTIYGIQGLSTGKVYFEFNYRGIPTEVEYYFGLVASGHDLDTLPGLSANSWAFVTEDVGFYTNSTKTATGGTYLSGITGTSRGAWYDYSSYFHRDGYVIRVAIDFDAGKLWFGVWNGSVEEWDGDPAAGTDPTYTFTPNTELKPGLGWKFTHTGFLCTAIVQLGCSRSFTRRTPPSGFAYWDEPSHQAEIIADSPAGYWLASPHVYNESWRVNSLGYPGQYADASGNWKLTEFYNGSAYNFLTADANAIFTTAPAYRWYAGANSSFGKYAVSLSSTASFTLEASVYVTGAGAVNGGSDIWTEGSGLVTNYIQANQQGSWTLGQSWVGIALRDRRFKFHLREYEVTAGSDVANGAHHIMAVFDASAQTQTLYIDGAQTGQTTSVTPTSASTTWLAWGALRPNQTNGNFPGYFRDCVLYASALSSTRVAAHYDAFASTELDLASTASGVVAAGANLTFLVELAAAAQALADSAAALFMAVPLAGAAAAQATATGDFPPMAITLDGVAAAESTASGDMSPHPLAGSAQAVSTAAGALASLIALTTEARTSATAAGDPDVLVAIAGAAASLATASAALGQATLLAGDAAAVAQAAASVVMQTGMGGEGQGQASAYGQIDPVTDLTANAEALATLNATLNQAMAVAGLAESVATAAGDLVHTASMSGAAATEASATGDLSPGEVISGEITYVVNLATGAVTNWTNAGFERLITAHGRTYALKGGVLYRIGGDVDPGDTLINSPVRFAQQTFGTNVLKTLDKVYVQARSQDGLAVTPIYDEELGLSYTLDADSVASIRPRKIPIGRGNYWFTMGMLIQNRDGGPMDIGGIEMIVNQNLRRVR